MFAGLQLERGGNIALRVEIDNQHPVPLPFHAPGQAMR
jgi:hypothetical protein